MVKVYAVVLAVGAVALIAWIFVSYLGGNAPSLFRFDPETRLGKRGRQVVAALVGFGMAGMAAEFSPRAITWPVALLLATVGAGAAAWYAGWLDRTKTAEEPSGDGSG